MKDINTLIPDIYNLVQKKDGWFTKELADELAKEISIRLQISLGEQQVRKTLRLSQMGPRCPRALWYSVNNPEVAEKMPPWAEIKFSYGHILEALVITLAKAAGHDVRGEQDALSVDGIVGHRDCVIDGHVVDVKSSTTRSFSKFKDGSLAQNDTFGYLDQLDGYLVGSNLDPIVQNKSTGYILAVDKQLGHLALCKHHVRELSIRERIKSYKEIVKTPSPPPCECETKAEGKSGNIALGTKAAYSPYKHACFPHLRTFLYSSGPIYLTKVVRTPDVPEIDKDGRRLS